MSIQAPQNAVNFLTTELLMATQEGLGSMVIVEFLWVQSEICTVDVPFAWTIFIKIMFHTSRSYYQLTKNYHGFPRFLRTNTEILN
jgi:hypothetical protein